MLGRLDTGGSGFLRKPISSPAWQPVVDSVSGRRDSRSTTDPGHVPRLDSLGTRAGARLVHTRTRTYAAPIYHL